MLLPEDLRILSSTVQRKYTQLVYSLSWKPGSQTHTHQVISGKKITKHGLGSQIA